MKNLYFYNPNNSLNSIGCHELRKLGIKSFTPINTPHDIKDAKIIFFKPSNYSNNYTTQEEEELLKNNDCYVLYRRLYDNTYQLYSLKKGGYFGENITEKISQIFNKYLEEENLPDVEFVSDPPRVKKEVIEKNSNENFYFLL